MKLIAWVNREPTG